MNDTALIDELTDICARQNEVIKRQAYALEQVGAVIHDEDMCNVPTNTFNFEEE